MRIHFILVISFFYITNVLSQRIEIQACGAYYLSYVEISSPYSKNSYQDVGIMQFAYFQKIRKNFSLGLRASYYDPIVSFNIEDYPFSGLKSMGSASGTFFNLTILASYKYSFIKRLNFNLYIGINNSYYRDYFGLNEIIGFNDIYKGETIVQGTSAEVGFEGFQLRPEVSVGIEWLFLKYFSLEANVAYIQGTRRIQELEVRYILKDSQEYFGKNYSNGSMYCLSIGLSFYFGGYPMKINNIDEKNTVFPKQKRRKVFK